MRLKSFVKYLCDRYTDQFFEKKKKMNINIFINKPSSFLIVSENIVLIF